jgi:hypothetical protein
MGANAQTSVPLFVANSVLTAAQQNISAATGVPVFATTVTRDAAFGGSNKVLAEGQLAYIEATNVVQYYDGAAWATVGPASAAGLVRIGSASLSGSSTNITSVFSTTYKNYRVVVDNAVCTDRGEMRFRIGANVSTGIYYSAGSSRISNATSANTNNNGGTAISFGNWEATIKSVGLTIELQNPFEALTTNMQAVFGGGSTSSLFGGFVGGLVNDTTSYTGFTLFPEAGTFSSGTVTVYGYANS